MNKNADSDFPTGSAKGESGFEELIDAIRTGDEDALQELMESCRDYLLLIANQELDRDLQRKLGPSDIVQNTMFAAVRNVGQFRGNQREQFLAWIRKILLRDINCTRRKHKDAAKRDTSRERTLEGDSRIGLPATDICDSLLTPQTSAVRNEEQQMLEIALGRMSDDFRMVILLRNSEQLSFDLIGERMNRSADAAQKLWTRAIVKLKAELKALNVL